MIKRKKRIRPSVILDSASGHQIKSKVDSSILGSCDMESNDQLEAPRVKTERGVFAEVIHGFSSLRDSPPELYKNYMLKFLDSYSYFSFSIIFTLFLSDDFGFSDVQAGAVYGVFHKPSQPIFSVATH